MDIRHVETPETKAGGWLGSVLPVRRDEALTVTLLALNCFILLLCYYVLKVVREPLIILGGGAELKSYASGGQVILLLAIVPAFSWLQNRVSRIRLMTTMQIIFIGCLVGFYVLARAKAPIGLAFYIWLGIFNALVVSNFWSFANDLFTERDGKRLFAVIGIGASFGAIVGAYTPHLLYKAIGFDGLMMLAVVGLGASIFLYQVVDRRERARKAQRIAEKTEQAPAVVDEAKKDKRGGFTLVLRDKYLRMLALMLLVSTIINTTGEYVITKMAETHADAYAADKLKQASVPVAETQPTVDNGKPADPKAVTADKKKDPVAEAAKKEYLSDFFSTYYFWVNIVSFILQAFLVARLLIALGMRKALFIMPVIVLGGWVCVIAFIGLTMVRIEKTSENSLDYSLNNTLRQALFLPTSPEAKYKAKAAIDTFFFRMGDVIASLGIVFLF
ncbi:MAG: MFS transporter, partial [Kofleriaceae bacterium]